LHTIYYNPLSVFKGAAFFNPRWAGAGEKNHSGLKKKLFALADKLYLFV
jgi:hypothetical protein